MAERSLEKIATECYEVREDNCLFARIVPHDSGFGWKGVDLSGRALTTQPYETPQLVLKYLP